ncbi:odorant receptor 46a-like [Sipha flava]|uniref:Odorant receptor n=2 Tax=Sipha flava TaxID=143950 RepID=A0A8B8GCM4_9HEMI|nr:odorant receptor 46a-like [Sipha flava]
MAMLVVCGTLSVYKGHVMVANADLIWDTLHVARYAFITCAGRDESELRRAGSLLRALLRAFVAVSYQTLAIWIAIPWLTDDRVPVANGDGTMAEYRMNVNNLWTPLPVAVYNATAVWAVVYAIEVFLITVNVFFWALFDCYLVTMCFVLNAQFHTIAAAYEKLAWSPSPHRHSGIRENNDGFELDHYDNLILHIKDNQRIMMKFNDFFDIVQPVILVQIVNGSFLVITLIYLTLLMYFTGWSIKSLPILKFFSGMASLTIELYIYCYAFNHIETKKNVVNFGLYSSNWTAMSIKFKRTLLATMKMNAAHQRLMKITPISIVNLEMFSKVMNMSYSVVTVLLNSNSTQTKEME